MRVDNPLTKSSVIDSVAITNYKSLRNVEFKPRPLSVLVGPNSSGKSNLLDAFRFVRDLVVDGNKAFRQRGEFNTIVWSGDSSQRITFRVGGELSWDTRVSKFRYSADLSEKPFNQSENKERFAIHEKGEYHPLLIFPFPENGAAAGLFDFEGKLVASYPRSDSSSHLHQFASRSGENQPVGFFADYLRSWEVYDFAPSMMRTPVSSKRDLRLMPHGENLGSVLHTIRSEYPAILRLIEDHLHTLVPESRNLLSLLTDKGHTYPGIEEERLFSRIPASSMSAGTLRFLAFLVALYSPGAPPLIGFEEPENNIHPRALELLVEILKSASARRQVIISTHSPHLLNLVDPDSVFVFDKKESETTITEAGTMTELNSLLRKVGLGEAWYAGTIGGVPATER